MNIGMTFVYLVSFFAVVIAMAFAAYLYVWVKREPVKNQTINKVSALISAGANAIIPDFRNAEEIIEKIFRNP